MMLSFVSFAFVDCLSLQILSEASTAGTAAGCGAVASDAAFLGAFFMVGASLSSPF
jgi:hypothetical protein